MVDLDRVQKIIDRFGSLNILVVGDIMLDQYLWGKVNRISPEAPVPVVRVIEKTFNMGGAANVAQNIMSLGARVHLSGIVGTDHEGSSLCSTLESQGLDVRGIISDNNRQTTLKTRVMAYNQQVVRIDHENDETIDGVTGDALSSYLREEIPKCDGVIISDYGKGVINEKIVNTIVSLVTKNDIICSIDPKIKNFPFYKNVTVLTPNHHEAAAASAMEINSIESIQKAGFALLKKTNCKMMLITWGKNGMGLFEDEKTFHHIQTMSQKVYDVTGAGDTVITVFTLALAAGATPLEAAELSNLAAGLVINQVGTASVTRNELVNMLN